MHYEWDDWTLDRQGGQLRRQGAPVEASRKVVECIRHLIAHRERIVGYDELALSLWGHGNASNHQLSQVILAARRLLGDDGQTQRYIRTSTGQGYHWVAPVAESMDLEAKALKTTAMHSTAPPTAAVESPGSSTPGSPPAAVREARTPHTEPQAAGRITSTPEATVAAETTASGPATDQDQVEPNRDTASAVSPGLLRRHRSLVFATLAACTVAVIAMAFSGLRLDKALSVMPEFAEDDADTLASLRRTLAMGRYDEVREALSELPGNLAVSPEAMLIAIDLDIQRGRFDRAGDKIDTQLKALQSPRDPIRHAQLLLRQSTLNSRRQAAGAEVFAPADAAVTLLLSRADGAPQGLLAEALRVRANGYNLTNRSEAALRDLAEALDIHEHEGDAHRVAIVRASRARTWMRMGRMTDALDELSQVADVFRSHEDKVNEVLARNTMAKIQIESLQWQDAVASTERSMRLLREMQDSDRRYPTMQLRALGLIGVGRLREASSLLEEADASGGERRNGVIPAIHLLEAGRPQRALEVAANDFHATRIDTRTNLLLENREGALLLWMMAAQALADRGETPPAASVAQLAVLESPTNAVARIARGRWLSLQGKEDAAERELRHSLQEALALNQRLRMIFAAEPLVDLALRRGDIASAQRVVDDLYGYDPETMNGDYRFNLLRLRIALADEKPRAYEEAHRRVMELAGERSLPRGVESLYVERRHRDGGPLWSGPVSSAER